MSVMPAMRNIVSARVSIQVLRMMRLNRWTNRRVVALLSDQWTASTKTFLRHCFIVGGLQGSYVQKESPSAQTAGLDCEPCHMPMAWTFLILDVQSFQMHRLVCSPGSIRC